MRTWQRPLAGLMLRQVGLTSESIRGDLDRLYVERLLNLVRESSLAAVVILAQEMVYDNHGQALPREGAFYVPNEYVLNLSRKHPELMPGVSIHSARRDALEELERCLAGGAVLMK